MTFALTPEAKYEALEGADAFRDISPPALEALAPLFTAHSVTAGTHLFRQGDDSSGMFVVLSGTLYGSIADANGVSTRVSRMGPSDSFGELALLLRGTRFLTVEAATPAIVLHLSLAAFRHLKLNNPDVCLLLIMTIVRRFGHVVDGSRDVIQRILLRQLAGIDAE